MWYGVCRIAPGLRSFSGYQSAWLHRDIVAGVSVAAIALPTGIAYSELAGVPAVYGMYSAIFPLLAYALFGSSRQLMTGPDAATCVLVAATLGPLAGGDPDKYLALMVVLSLLTGFLYLLGGVLRLGFIANFLSQPILTGFLNGIALIIVAGQLKKLVGYSGDASGFFPQLLEFGQMLDQSHLPTVLLGLGLLLALVILQRLVPKLPNPLIVVIAGIIAVALFNLDQTGMVVIGSVPAGLPSFQVPFANMGAISSLLDDAAGLALVSFTSGVLTAKSFARRNRYEVDANQELVAFGACNIASGLAQGFPVTGADSRTAVNDAMGGKTQLVGIVAAATMLLILLFLTAPLAYLPTAALAAVIMVSAVGLFDYLALRELRDASRVEMMLSVGTTAGVLILGVLPGVLLTVAASLIWLLVVTSRPNDAILGRVAGMKGFHSLADYSEATTIPGLLLYRFDSNLVFYNADYFKARVHAAIAASDTPIEWVIVDASPINIVDLTALQKIDELREELEAQGIVLVAARIKRSVFRFFKPHWSHTRREERRKYTFYTLKAAISAFRKRSKQV
jgi:high affinity sulfate transporter 1